MKVRVVLLATINEVQLLIGEREMTPIQLAKQKSGSPANVFRMEHAHCDKSAVSWFALFVAEAGNLLWLFVVEALPSNTTNTYVVRVSKIYVGLELPLSYCSG